MRCSAHPEQLASEPCSLCGEFYCSECLDILGSDSYCPTCLTAARAAAPAAPERSVDRRKLIGAAAGLALTALIATLALWPERPGPEPSPGRVDPDPGTRMARTFEALERGAVAVETYRAEQSRYPGGWDALVPGLLDAPPTDPFAPDRTPLSLGAPKWDAESVVLYSIGPDGRDDGGKAYSVDSGMGDIVYLVR